MRHGLSNKDFVSDNGFKYFHAVSHRACDATQTDNAVNKRKDPAHHLSEWFEEDEEEKYRHPKRYLIGPIGSAGTNYHRHPKTSDKEQNNAAQDKFQPASLARTMGDKSQHRANNDKK